MCITDHIEAVDFLSPRTKAYLLSIAINTISDLLLHFPYRIINYATLEQPIEFAQEGELVSLKLAVTNFPSQQVRVSPRHPLTISTSFQGQSVKLVFFHQLPSFIWHKLKASKDIIAQGKLSVFNRQITITQPKIFSVSEFKSTVTQEVRYPLAKNKNNLIHQAVNVVLERISLNDWHEQKLLQEKSWPAITEALKILHGFLELDENSFNKARERLVYDEIFAQQLFLYVARQQQKAKKNILTHDQLVEQFIKLLPFNLTENQQKLYQHLRAKQLKGEAIQALLQGDVGSGKTVLALIISLIAVSNHQQAAIMAPTDILATQHFSWFSPFAAEMDIRIALLTGRQTNKQKETIYKDLADGKIDIIIGTHALIQPKVHFRNLGIVIIDEQHRFGVNQRCELLAKGENPDLILMTATPIPRTLAMTLFGDLEILTLSEKPANRRPIITSSISINKIEEIYVAIKNCLSRGEKIYWVCPLIDDDPEQEELAALEARYNALNKVFPEHLVMLHGRLASNEKEEAMRQFVSGEKKLMVATTVIEVGVNVPDATIIIIEQAEKFGLAQLHQLRGRVGRSDLQSYCLLVYYDNISYSGKQRLLALKQSEDGFFLAEQDLEIRGSGDLSGTKQSGSIAFKLADLTIDLPVFNQVRTSLKEETKAASPHLLLDKYQQLLELFGYSSLYLKT